ncbi:ATP-dependent RNA helicase [Blastocladiella emersonii ATCC 22665]|nr:ATP-dependent RNA helicase [Blastocladiella emersonii ATCC 22665]
MSGTPFDLVQRGDISGLQAERGFFDPRLREGIAGHTLLHAAVVHNRTQVLQYLLSTETAACLNDPDNEGQSPLYLAAALGFLAGVEILLKAGAAVDQGNADSTTPLMIAAFSGHIQVVRTLLDAGGAQVLARNASEQTAMSLAATEGQADVVELLLRRGFPVDFVDQFGWTPLMLAAHADKAAVVAALLRAGADTNITAPDGKNAKAIAHAAGSNAAMAALARPPPPGATPVRSATLPHTPGTPVVPEPVRFNSLPADPNKQQAAQQQPPLQSFPRSAPQPMPGNPYGPMMAMHAGSSGTLNNDPHRMSDDLTSVMVPLNELQGGSGQATYMTPGAQATQQANQYVAVQDMARRKALHRRSTAKFDQAAAMAPMNEALNNLDTSKPGERSKCWVWFSRAVTFWAPRVLLQKAFGLENAQVRQAWREKMALCFIILLVSAVVGFLTFGFSTAVCRPIRPLFRDTINQEFGTTPSGPNAYAIVRGRLYDIAAMQRYGDHKVAVTKATSTFDNEQLKAIDSNITQFFGKDITPLFPLPPEITGCPANPAVDKCLELPAPLVCHVTMAAHQMLEKHFTGFDVAWSWDNITDVKANKLFVYSGRVYTLNYYLSDGNAGDRFLSKVLNIADKELLDLVGTDATLAIERSPNLRRMLPCLDVHFRVGRLDGTTVECLTSNLVTIIISVILLGLIAIKFVSATLFDWILSRKLGRLDDKHPDAWVICLVTCYSEDRKGLKTTLDSLSATHYNNHQKLLLVIADGNVTGAGQPKSTPEIVKDMLEPAPWMPSYPEPYSYVAIGDGPKRHNMAEVHAGFYRYDGQKVPFVLINKVGTPEEQGKPKAGNRGKRDSQLILMHWLNRLSFNDRMTPLDFDLSDKVARLVGKFPTIYEIVLMVDADTLVLPDSLGRMVTAFEKDEAIMGLCGETRIANKRASWVSMIQVFEYYISHHLGKAFESIFGGVTCLPGCFCAYRIRAPKTTPDGKKGKYFVPILASPQIVEKYSQNDVETLHEKNLLLLGEDRFLTTLMLSHFPKRKLIFVPRAVCKTEVPDTFSVLLSQRRRWINSTIHNLYKLVSASQLCGTFCFSMQFVVGIELVATLSLPAMLLFLVYLIVRAAMGDPNVILPLILMACMFLLQAILILVTTRKLIYIFWMVVYIFAIPIWNFVLPVYAFWHFDDFSWGKTRQIVGLDEGHGSGGAHQAKFDVTQIPMKQFGEWKDERSKYARKMKEAAREQQYSHQQQLAQSNPQHMYGAPPAFSQAYMRPAPGQQQMQQPR